MVVFLLESGEFFLTVVAGVTAVVVADVVGAVVVEGEGGVVVAAIVAAVIATDEIEAVVIEDGIGVVGSVEIVGDRGISGEGESLVSSTQKRGRVWASWKTKISSQAGA